LTDPDTRLQQLMARLKEGGHRLTPQRVAVLRILAISDRHPSVEQVYRQIEADFPTTSIATVYKTVALLKEMGEVLELGFADGSNRYDGNKPYPHPHLICTRCGEIQDLDADDLTEAAERMASESGYRILSHRLDFYGICARCQAADAESGDEGER